MKTVTSSIHWLVTFFIGSSRKLQPSFLFASATFLVEFVAAISLMMILSENLRFRGLFTLQHQDLLGTFVYFFFRVFILHLLFGFSLRILETIFLIRYKILFYLLATLYGCFFILIKYPQIYDEALWISVGLIRFSWLWRPEAVWALALVIVVFANLSFLRARVFTNKRLVLALSGNVFLIYFLFILQTLQAPVPEAIAGGASGHHPQKLPHLILLTIDSVRGDTDFDVHSGINSAFKNFLQRTFRFDRVISPIAQTHGALASLFSAQNVTTNRVRNNLSAQLLDTDLFLKGSTLETLQQAGYRIEFLRDNQEYAFFYPGRTVASMDAPSYDAANFFISPFFKDRVVFGLFNNRVGHFLLPEINNNASFSFSYDVADFATRVSRRLAELANDPRPTVLFIHTCGSHWPGIYPYPYYPVNGLPEFSKTPFSYSSKFRALWQNLTAEQWNVQAAFNKRIHDSGIEMLITRFLNPVFSQVEVSKLAENSLVVLFSDHGENFWPGGRKYPRKKYVEHGGSLIFGSDSELSSLYFSVPKMSGGKRQGTVGLIDIMPTVLDYLNLKNVNVEGQSFLPSLGGSPLASRYYYTETGLWPFSFARSQFITTPAHQISPLFKQDPKTRALYVDERHLPGIVQQKQRALYKDGFRYTVYPTNFGYREFLCDRNKDYFCENNLLLSEAKMATDFRVEMSRFFAKDSQSGALKVGLCSRFVAGQEFNENDVAQYEWQYLFQAIECLRERHAYAYATGILETLLRHNDVSPQVKRHIEKVMIFTCGRDGIYDTTTAPAFLKSELPARVSGMGSVLAVYARACMDSIAETRTSNAFYRKMFNRRGVKLDGAANRLETNESFEWDGGRRSAKVQWLSKYLNLEAEARGTNLRGPSLNRHSELANIKFAFRNDSSELKRKLQDFFKEDLSYHFTAELAGYFGSIFQSASKAGKELGMIELTDQLVNHDLPLWYFNYLTFQVDRLTKREGLPEITLLRRDLFAIGEKGKAYHLKSAEVGLALYKLHHHFKCAAQQTPLCQKVQKVARSNSAFALWSDLLNKSRGYSARADLTRLLGAL